MPIKLTDKRGLTLIEVMITVAVFSVLIMGLGQTVLVGQKSATEANRQAIILLGCQQVLEQPELQAVDSALAENGSTFTITYEGPNGNIVMDGGLVEVDKDLNGDGTTAGQTGDLYREERAENDLIRIRISFRDLNGNRRTIIEKVLARRSS